jgi:hypothetical protein
MRYFAVIFYGGKRMRRFYAVLKNAGGFMSDKILSY